MKQICAPVISNNKIMAGTHLAWLEAPEIAAATRPGQFVMVYCGETTSLRRPLSVHQVDGGKLALLFKIVGQGTNWLAQRQTGDTVDIFGPLGNGYAICPNSKNLLLVAGGIGIAPLGFLAQEALKNGKKVTLLIGAGTSKSIYPTKLLTEGILWVQVTNDGTMGEKCVVTSPLPGYIYQSDQIFACGPLPMYQAMAKIPELKSKSVQISLEMRMGCGLGACYGCTVKTKSGLKQVCKDGPVFDLFELDDNSWNELIL